MRWVLKEMVSNTTSRAAHPNSRNKTVPPTEEQHRCHPKDMLSRLPSKLLLFEATAVNFGCTSDELKCSKWNCRAWTEFVIERQVLLQRQRNVTSIS